MALSHHDRRLSLVSRYFAFLQRRKISDRFFLHLALIAAFVCVLYAGYTANAQFLTSVPSQGGTIVEGIVGTPRFVNPVLAITRADHDMVALVYSGLLKLDDKGNLVPDVAESITVSEDGRTYHVKLRKGVRFHNGAELTARDVAFTIGLIQTPELKSPLRGNWDGVQVEAINDYELTLTLEEPYAPFKANLTVGILPRELWDSLPIEQIPFSANNTNPIGSGPYMVEDVLRNESGLIEAYALRAFNASNLDPKITSIVFNFYQNEDELLQALADQEIASTPSLSPENLSRVDTDAYSVIQTPLPRTFAVYFNQNKSVALRDESVRRALDAALDKEALVQEVLGGYGIPTDSPVPVGLLSQAATSTEEAPGAASPETILQEGGWTRTEDGIWEKEIDDVPVTLSITIKTANTPLFEQTATVIADAWRALGVQVQVSQFEQTDLVQGVIRPRDFEALLYGADIGKQADLYPFWHSSQKNDPGLNIAQYTNIDVDALLERMRTQQEQGAQQETLAQIESIIKEDIPAVFLFVPTFTYVLDTDVSVPQFVKISTQSERFADIAQWHIQSNDLWPIFSEANQ